MMTMREMITLLPSGEGARRADEGLSADSKDSQMSSLKDPHPALRATFPQRGKGEMRNGAFPCF